MSKANNDAALVSVLTHICFCYQTEFCHNNCMQLLLAFAALHELEKSKAPPAKRVSFCRAYQLFVL